jgi:SPOR domain
MDFPAFGPTPHINVDEFARLLRAPSKPSSRLSQRVDTGKESIEPLDVRSSPGDATSIVDTDDPRTVDDFRRWWRRKLPRGAAQDHFRPRKLTRMAIGLAGMALISSALAPALLKRPPVVVRAETAGTPADVSSTSRTPVAPEADPQAVEGLASKASAQTTDPEPDRSVSVQADGTSIAPGPRSVHVKPASGQVNGAVGTAQPSKRPDAANRSAAADTPNAALPIGTPSGAKALQRLVESVVATSTRAEAVWVVQLGAQSSEAEAKRDLKRLNAKYRSARRGSRASLRKVFVTGQTAYRLRVVGLSRNEAASLCSRVKGDGGSCSIVR